MSFTLTKKFNDNTFHISITKNNKYYETTLKNITKEYYDNTLSKFDVDTVNIIDMKESLLVNYDSESIELNEILVSYIEYMELKKKLEIMEKDILETIKYNKQLPIIFDYGLIPVHVGDKFSGGTVLLPKQINCYNISTIYNIDPYIKCIKHLCKSIIENIYDISLIIKINIPPGKMMKVYETNNTKDYKVYHSGVYDGNIIKKGRMLWIGFVERQHDIPDNIEI